MKTTTIIFFSYLTIVGTFLPRVVPGAAPSKEKQPTQAAAPSPAFIYPNPVIPLPKNQGATSEDMEQLKKMPEFTEEQKKCITSFVNKGMSSCLEDIGNSFVTEKIKVRPQCCSALDGINEPCRLAIHFQNKQFEGKVKQYCAAGPGGPSAQTAADGPGSEGGFGDGSFPDSTGQLSDFGSAFGPGPAEGPGPSPFGSYDESYGPGAAEGPSSAEEASQEVGHMIEGSSPASNGDTVSEEAVGPIVEGSSPSSEGSSEGSSTDSEGSSKKGAGQKSEGPSPSSAGSSEGGAGTKSEGPSPSEGSSASSDDSNGAVGAKSKESSPSSEGTSQEEVGNSE